MKVLVACEFSGIVREAFAKRGHDAWSCDLLPTEIPSDKHIQGDVLEILDDCGWDLMIAHPPCTYLSRAGARWWKDEGRREKQVEAYDFVLRLRYAPIEKICVENPIGKLNKLWRYPDQTIQPYQFGHPYSKATCLWLKNLQPLIATNVLDNYQSFLPSNTGARKSGGKSQLGVVHNSTDASRTFQGIANAMAEQWGNAALLNNEVRNDPSQM